MTSILNASSDAVSHGISALCMSAVASLSTRKISPVAVADHGKGHRNADWGFSKVDLIGLSNTRRYWRSQNLGVVRAVARLGGLSSPTARVIARSKAILDVPGGDSLTDLYGPKRFRTMVLSKQRALDSGKKLILLPQTLGPFNDAKCRAEAVDIPKAADAVWRRDKSSGQLMPHMPGASSNPQKHWLGLDIAVALPQIEPNSGLYAKVLGWLNAQRDGPQRLGPAVNGPSVGTKDFRFG